MPPKDIEKRREYSRKYYAENKEKKREYGAKNKEKIRETTRKWNAKNKERKSEATRKWYVENKEEHRENVRKWTAENKERKSETTRKWSLENKEKIRETQRQWNKANQSKINKFSANRRAARLNATPAWLTDKQQAEMAAIYKEAMAMEKQTGIPHHVDHIVPLKGKNVSGLHVPWNLQILTATENMSKGNRLQE
jgi:hypothetical protein